MEEVSREVANILLTTYFYALNTYLDGILGLGLTRNMPK